MDAVRFRAGQWLSVSKGEIVIRAHLGRWLVTLLLGGVALGGGLSQLLQGASLRPAVGLALSLAGGLASALALYQLGGPSAAGRVQATANPAASAPEGGDYARPDGECRPRIVAIGGGHGLETLLRGLKSHPVDLTAIVTVTDDGGSSGLLRRERGMLPPGDLRRCIAALADAEPLMTRLFQYRFGRGAGLDGHVFGNLFITAMAEITGSFESGLVEASRVLAVRGRILPSSLDEVTLCAEVSGDGDGNGSRLVQGESAIAEAGGRVERVFIRPDDVKGYPAAIRALLKADLIVLGPGSLFTSILPNLLVQDVRRALQASPALKVYVCNVATQPGETDGYTVGNHVRALSEHVGPGVCDCVLANANTGFELPPLSRSEMVQPTCQGVEGLAVVTEDLVDRAMPWRHDPQALATALMRLHKDHLASVGGAQAAPLGGAASVGLSHFSERSAEWQSR